MFDGTLFVLFVTKLFVTGLVFGVACQLIEVRIGRLLIVVYEIVQLVVRIIDFRIRLLMRFMEVISAMVFTID